MKIPWRNSLEIENSLGKKESKFENYLGKKFLESENSLDKIPGNSKIPWKKEPETENSLGKKRQKSKIPGEKNGKNEKFPG